MPKGRLEASPTWKRNLTKNLSQLYQTWMFLDSLSLIKLKIKTEAQPNRDLQSQALHALLLRRAESIRVSPIQEPICSKELWVESDSRRRALLQDRQRRKAIPKGRRRKTQTLTRIKSMSSKRSRHSVKAKEMDFPLLINRGPFRHFRKTKK